MEDKINEPNYDCIFYKQCECTALNKLYCKYEKCNFYKKNDSNKEITYKRKI